MIGEDVATVLIVGGLAGIFAAVGLVFVLQWTRVPRRVLEVVSRVSLAVPALAIVAGFVVELHGQWLGLLVLAGILIGVPDLAFIALCWLAVVVLVRPAALGWRRLSFRLFPNQPERWTRPEPVWRTHSGESGQFAVGYRVTACGLVSGLVLAGTSVVALAALVILPLVVLDVAGDVVLAWVIVDYLLLAVGLVAIGAVAATRPGNVALRRMRLVLDATGVRVYPRPAWWWSRPDILEWADLERLEVRAGAGGRVVPYDGLDLVVDGGRTITLAWHWQDTSIEECVAHLRQHRPDLAVIDHREPPGPGLRGWLVQRRRYVV